MNSSNVGNRYPSSFGRYVIATNPSVPLSATGNAVATLSLVGTNSIIRRITVSLPSASVATGNIAIYTSNDGNTSNLVSANTVLTNVSATNTWQDLTLAAGAATKSYTSGAFYVCVNTAVAGTCQITVQGDVVSP